MAAFQPPSNLVEALNNAKLATKASKKVELLGQLHELLIRGDPAHLDAVLADVTEFQVDRADSVRKAVIGLVTAAVQVRCTPKIVGQAAACLSGMLGDDAVVVVKQAATAAHGVLRAGMSLHMSAPQGNADKDSAWAAAQQLQAAVSTLATSSTDAGLRMAGIKMGEQAAILYTAPEALALPDAATLVTTAESLVKQLGELLKEPTVQQLPGPVVICCIKALGAVVMQRANMVHRGMPALLALATKGIFRVPSAGDGLSPIAASCGTALKDILNRIIRSNAEATKTWQKRLESALRTMGADALADSALRHIERQAAKLRANEKRKAPEQGGPDLKVSRISTPTAPDSSVNNTPARTPTPTPGQQQQGGNNDLLSQLLSGNLGSGDLVSDTQRVFEALVKGEQMAAVETILAQIEPGILAELVVRWMVNLPPQPAGQSHQQPLPPQPPPPPPVAASVAEPRAPAAVQALPAVAQQQQQQQQTQQAVNNIKPEADAGRPPPPPPPQKKQQDLKVDPRKQSGPVPAAAAAPAAVKLPTLLPQPLNQQQLQHMRKSAVQRILRATKNKPIRNFRELLLSRLVSQAPQADGLTDLVLQQLLGDYHGQRGHILVIRWLYALAAALAAAGEGMHTAAAAGDGGRQQRQHQKQSEEKVAEGLATAAAATGPEAMDGVEEADEVHRQADPDQEQKPSEDAPMQEAAAVEGPNNSHSPVGTDQQQQQAGLPSSTGSHDSSRGQTCHTGGASDLSATPYDTVLTAVLQGLRQHLPSEDPAIPRVLQEAPVLPLQSVVQFLKSLITDGDDWAALAINAAELLVETRPPMRTELVQLVLDAAVAVEPGTRELAVSLVVSKLLAWQEFTGHIIEYARDQLLRLLDPHKLMHQVNRDAQQQQQQDEQQAKNTAAEASEAGAGRAMAQQEQQQTAAEDALQPNDEQQADESAEGKAAQHEQQQQQQQQAVDAAHAQEQKQQELRQEQQQEQQQEDQQQEEVTLDIDVAAQHCMLFMSLCAGKPELMTMLLETYGKAGPEAHAGMERYAASLARAVGPSHPTLLDLIKSPPEGSKDLLLMMINALVENIKPPVELVEACAAYSTSSKDVVLLAPVTPAMAKAEVLRLLPQFVTQLSRVQLRMLYRKLTSAAGEEPAHFKPTELLVALHQVKSTAALRVTTKQQTAALDVALHAPEVFPVAVVVQSIRRLESLTPLPQLFMRSVITALQISPKLTDTVMELLRRLIQKQIWLNERQWQGFIICCEKAAPASYPVLLQLPSNILEQAMEKLNERHWKPLLHYALSKECVVPVYGPTKEVLNLFLERLAKRQRERATAAGITPTNDGATSGAVAGASISSSSAAKPKGGVKLKQPSSPFTAAGGKAAAKSVEKKPTGSSSAGPASDVVADVGNHQQEEQQKGGNAAGTDQAAVEPADQQEQPQQQGSDDGGGGDDDFMLDFEDDE